MAATAPLHSGGLPASDAAAYTPTTAAATGTYRYEEDAAANEWTAPLETLTPPKEGTFDLEWGLAVSAPLVVMSRLVAPYFDAAATRVAPTYGAVVVKLRELGLSDAVPMFQAAWADLRSQSDGRAVIAVCRVAATGGLLLGRWYHEDTMECTTDLEGTLTDLLEGKSCLPACLAAIRYYRTHYRYVPPPTDDLPSMDSLMPLYVDPDEEIPPAWFMAVSPALMAMERIVARYMPAVRPARDFIVTALQERGLDEKVPAFRAAWQELHDSEDGRAVIAVCSAAIKFGMALGNAYCARAVSDPGLEGKVAAYYRDEECLPALRATFRRYHAEVAKDAAAAAAFTMT